MCAGPAGSRSAGHDGLGLDRCTVTVVPGIEGYERPATSSGSFHCPTVGVDCGDVRPFMFGQSWQISDGCDWLRYPTGDMLPRGTLMAVLRVESVRLIGTAGDTERQTRSNPRLECHAPSRLAAIAGAMIRRHSPATLFISEVQAVFPDCQKV